jgi:hypothetical protein
MEMKFLKISVFHWHNLLKNGQESLENWHSGRLAPLRKNENVAEIYTVVMSDQCVQWNRQ